MPDPMPRELSVTYGGFTVGGGETAYQLDGKHRITRTWNRVSFECDVLVVATSEADFATRCTALEDAFRQPDKALIVQLGSKTLLQFSDAPKDWATPAAVKVGDQADTGRTRLYRLRVDVDPSADQLTPQGLREAQIDVAFLPSRRRTVAIAGVWTAIDQTGARDAYEGGIESYASGVLADLGGTYELAEETATQQDRVAHLLAFRRVYEERLWAEAGAAADDDEVVRQVATFRKRRTAPGDSNSAAGAGTETAPADQGVVKRLATIDVSYTAWIVKTVTDLPAKWDQIKDWLVGVVQSDFNLGGAALIDEAPSFDYDNRRITAQLVIVGTDGSKALERTISISTDDNDEEVLVPAWNGKRFARYAYNGPTELIRTVTVQGRDEGFLDEPDVRAKARSWFRSGTDGVRDADKNAGRWTRGRFSLRTTRRTLGLDGNTLNVTDYEATWQRRWYELVENGQGGSVAGGTRAGEP